MFVLLIDKIASVSKFTAYLLIYNMKYSKHSWNFTVPTNQLMKNISSFQQYYIMICSHYTSIVANCTKYPPSETLIGTFNKK